MDIKNKNPFQKLETHEELPEHVKSKVMTSVNLGMLVKDFTDLFTAKAGNTVLELMKGKKKKDEFKSNRYGK